ncbi:hypothetical protein Tco_0024380 [Tanacetum coccineum]
MPSTPGGIESSCSRNASISSIRKSLPPKGVKDGERESIIRFEVEIWVISHFQEKVLVSPTLNGPDWSSCRRVICSPVVNALIKARAVPQERSS